MGTKRIFTFQEACELLPEIRALTADAVSRAEELQSLGQSAAGSERIALDAAHDEVVRDWARQMLSLGVEVKGLWLIDFDSGDGIYYCWRHPEPDLEYFHDYDTGFAGRRPLGALKS